MERTLILLQNLLKITAGIPMTVISKDKLSLTAFLQDTTALPKIDSIWQQVAAAKNNDPLECHLSDNRILLIVPLKITNKLLALGPVVTTPAKDSVLPVAEHRTLYKIGELISEYTLNQSSFPVIPADPPQIHHSSLTEEDISQMRQVEQRYEYSAALTDAVQQGNLSLAMHLVGSYNPNLQTTVRNRNPLRNAQNYCIVLNTQLRHALEKSGIHPYHVDRLSNEIGLEIEQLKHISQLPDFFKGVIRRYCRLVQEHAYPNLRPLTNLAVTYIKEHLADNLTVKDTAKALTINANYLSSLFHNDMGLTFIDFVNKERTDQAAALLRHTNLQIQQIASTVGYNNTSYFAKQFVRFQGVSPSHYRREI